MTQKKIVLIHYTLRLDNGELIESNTEETPLRYTLGSGDLMSGLEEILENLQEGEERSGTLPPEKAYGPARADALIEVPREHLPPAAWKQGALLQAAGPKGEQIEGVIKALNENSATVDFNHPLAGKSLVYTIKLLRIQ